MEVFEDRDSHMDSLAHSDSGTDYSKAVHLGSDMDSSVRSVRTSNSVRIDTG